MTARKAPEDLLIRVEKDYIESIKSSRKEKTMAAKKTKKVTVNKKAPAKKKSK